MSRPRHAGRHPGRQAGVGLVELLVTIAIGAITTTALLAFLASGRETATGREVQAEAQAALRLAIDRFARDARQAIAPDAATPAVASLSDAQVVLHVDPRPEPGPLAARPLRVRYAVSGGRLTREEAEPLDGTSPAAFAAYGPPEVLAEPVVAGAGPPFAAFTGAGTALPAPVADPSLIRVVRIDLSVGQRVGTAEATARVSTDVTLRNGL